MLQEKISTKNITNIIDIHKIHYINYQSIPRINDVIGMQSAGLGSRIFDKDMLDEVYISLGHAISDIMVNGCTYTWHMDKDVVPYILIEDENGEITYPYPDIRISFNGYRCYYEHKFGFNDEDGKWHKEQGYKMLMCHEVNHEGNYTDCNRIRNDLNKYGYYDGNDMDYTLVIAVHPDDFELWLSDYMLTDVYKDITSDTNIVTFKMRAIMLQKQYPLQGRIFIRRNDDGQDNMSTL